MKRTLIVVFMLVATAMAAQKGTPATADKKAPVKDPTQLGDFLAPEILCLHDLSFNITPANWTQVFVEDLVDTVYDNATPANQIRLGLRIAGTGSGFPLNGQMEPQNSLMVSCAGVGDTVNVEVWAMDKAGNATYCTTEFRVLDNFMNCPTPIHVNVCTQTFCSGMPLSQSMILLYGSVNFAPPFSFFDLNDTNDTDGCWDDLTNNVPIASTFKLTAERDDDPRNGVDLQDLQLLSMHLNGQQPFTENWQWVAADINHDHQITLEDSIELQRVIDHDYLEFPNNTSWRFVLSGYQFPSPDPLSQSLPDTVTIAELTVSMDTTFLGIKIGDLDCTANPQFAATPVEGRIRRLGNTLSSNVSERNASDLHITAYPNPAKAASVLTINMPQAGRALISLTDVQGKTAWKQETLLVKGLNSVEIRAPQGASGLFMWNVRTALDSQSGKLIFH